VAGTIDGEVASGAGRVLSGVEGSASDGLRVVVDADTPVSGVTMDVRRGIAERVEAIIAGFTDSIDGTLVNRENSYTAQIEDIDTQVGKIDERLELRRAGLQAQFLNMERLLAQFQSQESFLNSQLNAINNMNVSQANRGK
jgi:flagellar hook-associated protein 2